MKASILHWGLSYSRRHCLPGESRRAPGHEMKLSQWLLIGRDVAMTRSGTEMHVIVIVSRILTRRGLNGLAGCSLFELSGLLLLDCLVPSHPVDSNFCSFLRSVCQTEEKSEHGTRGSRRVLRSNILARDVYFG